MKHTASLPLVFLLLVGCASPGDQTRGGATHMERTELFFGLSVPDQGQLGQQQWQSFVDESITPRFPDGFTVIDADGQWRDSSGKISHERSKVLLILHPHDAKSIEKLDEIRSEYKKRFSQESVIRETSDAWVSF